MIEQFIKKLQETKDINLLRNFVSSKSLKNINEYLIKSEDNSLNLLHICIGFEESEFSLDCIQYLLTIPEIDINCLAKIDRTVWITGAHYSVIWSHYKVLQTLIDHGIDLFICDSYGKSANEYAIEKGDNRSRLIIEDAIHAIDINKTEANLKLINCLNEFKDILNLSPKSPNESDFEKTIEYFDENQNILKTVENKSNNSCDSEDMSGNTLISNISYEKTESVKSFCSEKTEIYVYNDRDHNILLIEERFEGCANSPNNSQNENQIVSKGCVTQSIGVQSLKEIELMNGSQLFNELRARGDSPGPILPSTKKYYQNRLYDLRRGSKSPSPSKRVGPLPNYSDELNLLLESKFPFDEALKLEKQFIDFFEKNHCKQNNFIYLLIDPNISENIPLQANSTKVVVNCCAQIDTNLFKRFIKSIFYVGKGQGNRVYEHFYEAIKSNNNQKIGPKVDRIHQIWSSNKGVTSLHCFHGINSSEALSREAMIIEALNLSNLTNQVNGQTRIIRSLNWTQKKKRLFGSYLLFKAFGIYILTGERQIRRPDDK